VTVIPFTDAQRLRAYRNMAGLTGADLDEHKRIFPDFAKWLAEKKQEIASKADRERDRAAAEREALRVSHNSDNHPT
jgi:hypothetical protein